MGYYFGCSHWIWAVCLLCAACFLFPVAQGQGIEWLKRPVTTSAREGENVTFTCRLNVEDPNIIWVKNVDGQASTTILFVKDSRFEADDRLYIINRYDLVITDVRRSDNGQYACRTKDAGIQAANLTVLLFPGQPSISRSKRGPVYTEDDDVTFTCSSTGGNPNPTITWLKNGNISTAVQQVSEATSVGGTTSSAITVRLDKTDHQANYSCLVSNELNFNSPLVGSTLVSVQYSPSIAFRPYSPVYAVRLGESAQVTCDVDANPLVTSVRWSKDGVNLAGTAPQRVLSPASKSDSGEYTCTATNSIGEKSGKLRVDVQYPPIVKAEASIVVPEGKDVVVECEVDSNPQPYEVQWSRERPSGSSQTLVTASTLSLMSVTRDQAGNYSCSAQNQLKLSGKRADFREGKAFSYIYVQYQPGPASIGPVPDVDVGERLDITCTAEPRGYPEASYRWTKDGQSLSETRQTLTIASVSLLDNGRYSCTPSNSQGSGQAAFVEVNVFEPPMIINPPTPEISMFLADPRLLTLTCEAQGYPQPQVTWFRTGDNQPLNINTDFFTVVVKTTPVDDYSVKVESSLQFKGLQREESTEAGSSQGMQLLINDMGNYSCHAESEKHSEVPVASTQIFINFPPALTLTPTRLAVTAGDQAVFRCAAQAHPDPGFQWFFRGRQLSSAVGMVITSEKVQSVVGGFQSRLVLSRVSDRSYGQYSCLVANALGNATRYIQLSRKSSPEQPGDLTAVSVTWESALLRWQPGFDGGFSQDFYIQRSGGSEEPRRLKVTPSSAISYNVTTVPTVSSNYPMSAPLPHSLFTTLTELRPSATYTFQVLPENDMGFGKASSPITITTNALKIPTLPKIPVYEAGQRKLVVVPPSSYGNNYCLRVEVRGEGGKWSPVNGCMKVMGDTLEIAHTGITAVNVSVCLSIRTDVCGVPTAAEINDNRSDPILTETHVIIIACVCGIIIVTLLIILFCFIFRRRKNAAKNYESGTPAGDPPPYTSVNSGPQKKPHQNSSGGAVVANSGGYDNQDGPLELQHQPPADDAAAMLYLGRHHGQQQHSQNSPRRLADEEKHLYENQLNQWSENNRMESYPNRDAQSPNKDKYIDLQDRGGGGDMLDYGAGDPSGQPGAGGGAGGGGKPKKMIRWRWRWRQKKTRPAPVPQFSHNPPGHTCGLPCCNHDEQEQQLMANPTATQRGCVTVPIISPAELSESNFFMRRRRGVDASRPLSAGYISQDKRNKKFPRRNSDGHINDSSDDGWATASADENFDDDEEEVDDNATLLRDTSKQDGVDSAKPRTLRFTRNTSIMAPEARPEMAGVPRKGEWQGEPTLLRHRQGGRLEPWEAVRQRRIALPDTPHTAHSIMFLNHQPGETSDFTETLQRNTKGDEKLEVEDEKNTVEGEDAKVDRFPMQFGQWDGVEGYASGTLPSARNIVDGLRRREEDGGVKEEQKQESGEKKNRERLYKTRVKGKKPIKCKIDKSEDGQSETTNSPTSTSSETNNSGFAVSTKILDSEQMKSLSNSMESLKSLTHSGMRRRSGNSKLPPLPTAEVNSSSPIGSPPTSPSARSATLDSALVIEEDVESLAETSSLYDDHVYDVPSEVRAIAANDRSIHQSNADGASFGVGYPDIDKSDLTEAPQLERKNSLDEMLPNSHSDASLFDTNSLAYSFYPNNSSGRYDDTRKIKNNNTESYIYNGSLLSVVSSDSDSRSALYYHRDKLQSAQGQRMHENPAAILRNRLKNGDGSIYGRPIIFMMGGKPIVFSESSPYQTDNESIAKESLPDSASLALRQGHDLHFQRGFLSQPVTMPVADCLPLTVDVGDDCFEPKTPYPVDASSYYCDCEECQGRINSVCPGISSAGLVSLDPSTKLKLWDLRLICLNREENQYSTYPPRRPTLDDRGVGPVDAADSLYNSSVASSRRSSRVLRHRSDVSTDHYVTRKINRLLRAPVLTRAELPPMPSDLSSSADVGDQLHTADRDTPDFPTAGLRSLYHSFLGEEDLESPSPLGGNGWSMYPAKEETSVLSVSPAVPACLNPYRSVMANDGNTETPIWPVIFPNEDDKTQLHGWRNFFTEKMSQATKAGPGTETDKDAISSGCPKPLPINWPFGAEGNAVKACVESGDETDDSVYIYKPLGFSGMYEWGRGRGRSGGEESSSSNLSSDDVSRKRNHHFCKRRRNHHGQHHHHHRAQRHLTTGPDKSHVDSLLLKKKGSETTSNGKVTKNSGDKEELHKPHTGPSVAVMTSDGDEDSPAYDSSSIYNASIRSGGSSSVYYGGTSNMSTSTSHSNLQNINNNNNIADGASGSSSSDSNHKMSLTARDSSKSLQPGPAPGYGKSRNSGTDRRGNQVIWGDASIVDWRRQAAKFRDNNFITLIL